MLQLLVNLPHQKKDDLGSLLQLQPGVLLPPEGDFDGCIHVSNQIQKDEDLSGSSNFSGGVTGTLNWSILNLQESHCQLEILEVEDISATWTERDIESKS